MKADGQASKIREIWFFAFNQPDKLRPVLVLTRQEVIELLHTVIVAPITSTIRGATSEVIVGIEEGLKHNSAVTRRVNKIESLPESKQKALLKTIDVFLETVEK